MPTRSPEIITRASQLDEDLVPEPWDARDADSDRSLVAERERYRLQGVTGEDGAGIVPAYNLNVADTEAIPQKTQDGWTRGSAGRVLNAQGRYVSRGSDVSRLSYDGEDPGLLVEAVGRTNHVPDSSDASQWSQTFGNNGGVNQIGSGPSILDGETAYELQGSGASNDAAIKDSGTFTGGVETALFIIEQGTATITRPRVRNGTNGLGAFTVAYDWGSGSASIIGGVAQQVEARVLAHSNVRGNKVVKITVRYDVSNNENLSSGNGRQIQFRPDDGGGNSTWFHHAQIEEAPNASSPIVTQGSPVTRSGDDYGIPVGDWHNSSEGTWIIDLNPLQFHLRSNNNYFDLGNANNIVSISGDEPFDLSSFNGNDTLRITSSINAFSENLIGLTHDSTGRVLSINGTSKSDGDQGNLGNIGSSIDLGGRSAIFSRVIYFPRALPESTLNRITS